MSFRRSPACCIRPPFRLPDLPQKGEFSTIDGIDTYVTGPSTALYGIFVIYDIFGRYPQTFYGADILAYGEESNATTGRQYQVFVPDFYGSNAADYAWYPPTTPEKAAKLDEFFAGPAEIETCCTKLISHWRTVADQHPEITQWALLGYCYGAEIAQHSIGTKLMSWIDRSSTSTEGPNNLFKALLLLHAGFTTEIEVARAITMPTLVLNSGEETQEEMATFLSGTSSVGTKVQVEWFKDQVHGWMAARGELTDEKVMKAFLKGYQIVRGFLEENT